MALQPRVNQIRLSSRNILCCIVLSRPFHFMTAQGVHYPGVIQAPGLLQRALMLPPSALHTRVGCHPGLALLGEAGAQPIVDLLILSGHPNGIRLCFTRTRPILGVAQHQTCCPGKKTKVVMLNLHSGKYLKNAAGAQDPPQMRLVTDSLGHHTPLLISAHHHPALAVILTYIPATMLLPRP